MNELDSRMGLRTTVPSCYTYIVRAEAERNV